MSTRIRISIALLTSVAVVATTPATTVAARRSHTRANLASAQLGQSLEPALRSRMAPLRTFTNPFGSGSSLVGSTPVGNGPGALAVDPATHTAYVANGFNNNGPNAGGNTLSVIDTRRCDAQDVSRCKGPWPTITVGNLPSAIAIDARTDTVYAANFDDGTVSVFNGATCNGENTTGCGQTPATVSLTSGSAPIGMFADPANHTVYIANVFGPDVSMLDSAQCNATDLGACATTAVATVNVGSGSGDVDVDQATHTVYVTTGGALNGWSVFDANACNAADQSGCGSIGFLTGDPAGPDAGQVDAANDTLYTANFDNTVSVFDLHDCNAADLSGCATDLPGTVTVPAIGFDASVWLAIDVPLRSVYVDFQKSDALRVINTDVCSGSDPAGCATLTPPEIHTGGDPEMVRLDPRTQTLYTANQVDNDVSVIAATRCDAQNTSGCRQGVPEAPVGSVGFANGLAVDPTVDTVYDLSGPNTVSMINSRACNAFHTDGCAHKPPAATVGDAVNNSPASVAVDPATHTVYVANQGSGPEGSVSVFSDRACNSTVQTACGAVSTLQIPAGFPTDIAVNPATDTVYVAAVPSSGPNLIWVFDGANCNASDTVGCGQTPASMSFADSDAGNSFDQVAVDVATDTVYAINDTFAAPFVGDSVYVFNGASCAAAHTSGCGQTPATVTLNPQPSNPFGIPGQEPNPFGIAVDQRTDTIYTANLADGEGPGTVSVINGAVCNGQDTSGCGQTPATAPAGFGTVAVAVDQLTNHVYASNLEDTSVTTINGNTCNGTNAAGCGTTRTRAIVGDYPEPITVDPFLDTAYVGDAEGVSVMPLTP